MTSTIRTAAPTAKVIATHIYRLTVVSTGSLAGTFDEYAVTNDPTVIAKFTPGLQADGKSIVTEVSSLPAGYVVSKCQPATTATGTTTIYLPDLPGWTVTCGK